MLLNDGVPDGLPSEGCKSLSFEVESTVKGGGEDSIVEKQKIGLI